MATVVASPQSGHASTRPAQSRTASGRIGLGIYSPGRIAVDLMRMRHKLGESVARVALRRYLARRDARVADLMAYAKALNALGPVRASVDVLAAS